MNFLQDQSLKAIEIADLGERCSERHIHQYQKVRLAINFSDSFIFSNKGNVCAYTFKTWTNPECDSFSVISHKGKLLKRFFFLHADKIKMPVTVWRGKKKKEFCLIPRPYHHFPDVNEKGLDKMWNSPPYSPSATPYLLVSCLHNKTEHHLWQC